MKNLSVRRTKELEELLDSLEIWCDNLFLLDVALTHSSFTFENKLSFSENNERLEFLGDAVLKLISSIYLFERYPDYPEGEMTKIRAILISDNVLSKVAEKINLGKYIKMGYHEEKAGGRKRSSNLACAFEALLGAFYLDGKMEDIQELFIKLMAEEVTNIDNDETRENCKAVLQEFTQALNGSLPVYNILCEYGPPHDRTFEIEVLINDQQYGVGIGKSKKEAQQSAAKVALNKVKEVFENDMIPVNKRK